MTVMGDAFMEELSDRGSIPLRSIHFWTNHLWETLILLGVSHFFMFSRITAILSLFVTALLQYVVVL